jgi:hypothetical protein
VSDCVNDLYGCILRAVGARFLPAADLSLAQRIKALRRHMGFSSEPFGRLFFVSLGLPRNGNRSAQRWGLTLRALGKEMAKKRDQLLLV